MGPTAVGKTNVAIRLAQKLSTEILSADSRQCYADMVIGTARPSPDEMQVVKHHFIGEFPITRLLTAADYEEYALGCLAQIFTDHDNAVVCGGTGLYINALCYGLDAMPPVREEVTNEVQRLYNERGIEALQSAIEKEDLEFFTSGEILNPHRVMRALAFVRCKGVSILSYRTGSVKSRPFDIVKIGLDLDRDELYARINKRVDAMMQKGLLEEAQSLYAQRELKNLQTVGYSELFEYMDGKLSLNDAVDKIKQHTRNYAKRQLTWFRKDKDVNWFRADDPAIVEKIVASALVK